MKNTDLFLWANNTDAYKKELNIELFLFNKNYTPFSVNISEELGYQLLPLFLYDVIHYVNLGAAAGLQVRSLEDANKDKGVVYHEKLENVGRAETLLHLIENERNNILQFSHEEHDFKRIMGVVPIDMFNDLKRKYIKKVLQM